MKILITGTNGFVGKNLQEFFRNKSYNLYCPKRGDLNLLDSQGVFDYLTTNKFDVVIHCGVTLSSVEENLKMYFNIERCSDSFGKLICIGSGAEYDKDHYIPKMKEDYFGKYIPQDIYGFSKYVIAKDIESIHRNIYNLRVFGIYGKHEDYNRRFISNNICRLLCDLDISMNRNMFFDYLYVDDFSRIVEMFINKDPLERSYNICNGTPVDFLTFAQLIKETDARDKEIIIKQDGLNPEYSGDNSLFLTEFGDFEFTSHEQAIKELYLWYQKELKKGQLDLKDFN